MTFASSPSSSGETADADTGKENDSQLVDAAREQVAAKGRGSFVSRAITTKKAASPVRPSFASGLDALDEELENDDW